MQSIEVRRNETADNESFQPRVGAFEVFVEWVGRDGISVAINIFSKLESLRYPNPNNIVMRLKTLLDRGGAGKRGNGVLASSAQGEMSMPVAEKLP